MQGTEELGTKRLPTAESYSYEKASTLGQEERAKGVIKTRVN